MRTAAAILAALLLAAPLHAASAKKPAPAPKDAADRFSLDLPSADGAPAEPAPAEAAPDAAAGRFTLDTPIAQLLADDRAKAVLDRDMPGLSTDKNLDKVKPLSLRRLAPLSGGKLSAELLEKVGRDLAKIEEASLSRS